AAVWGTRAALEGAGVPLLPRLLACVAAGGVLFGVGLAVFSRPLFLLVRAQVAGLLPPRMRGRAGGPREASSPA
ncbi:MAG TPA: hypothetical protein VHG91_18215, partial [Longimicrobium sp.]|nr:hypothetical protein [Longimicrobium sp.]